jgi:hypothetical protein
VKSPSFTARFLRLIEQAREIADRLEDKCAGHWRVDVSVEVLPDRELFAIIRGGPGRWRKRTFQEFAATIISGLNQ